MKHGGGPVVLVNGRAREAVDTMHYDQVVRAAGFDPCSGVLYTVAWATPESCGALVLGGAGVETEAGMAFSVVPAAAGRLPVVVEGDR